MGEAENKRSECPHKKEIDIETSETNPTFLILLGRAVYGLPGSHWFMAFSSILVIPGKQLELNGS